MNEDMNNGAKHSLMVLHEVALVGPLEELRLRCCGAVGDHRGVECIPDLPGREDEAPAHQWVEERRSPFPVQSSDPVGAGVR